jgi:ferric-dicitrate binding protein FerR (iron transport regulator)
MSHTDSHDAEDRFIEAWRRWARRPPARSPADAAAAVSRRLPPRRQPRYWWALAAAAALMMTLAIAVHWSNLVRRASPPGAGISPRETTPIGNGEVLIWLDEQTPLYMTFQPSAEGQASENKS